jgi:hypothetical protein
MTKYPVWEEYLDNVGGTEKEKRGLNIHVTRNEKVMLVWVFVCLLAGGLITQL